MGWESLIAGFFLIVFTAIRLQRRRPGFIWYSREVFLNISDNASSISPYSLMTVSVLTGQFTDKATGKLKEAFEVSFYD